MKAADYLAALARLPEVTLGSVVPDGGGIVVVAPHPDDESLGCGGLIAAAVAEQRPVHVFIVSDGSGSHPGSKAYPPARLARIRAAEARAAVTALGLGPDDLTLLGLRDGAVPSGGRDFEAAVEAIAHLARREAAGALFATWLHDPHGDHRAAFLMARAAADRLPGVRLFGYPIWAWRLPAEADIAEAEPDGFRLDVREHLPAKRCAIAAHRSQTTLLIDDDPAGFRIEPEMLRRFDQPHEIFLRA